MKPGAEPPSLAEIKLAKLRLLRQLHEQKAEQDRIVAANRPRRWATPGDMARELDPLTVQTPALDLIDRALVTLADSPGQNRLAIFMPPQEGKLIADTTPVPTPDGWTRHGDLRPGSVVFHPSGRQVEVVEVHPPAVASMRVSFSDHTSVLVHPAHEWTVWDRGRHRWITLETRELAASRLSHGTPGKRGHKYRYHLPVREALTCPEAELPVDPYTLGVWLGDGSSTKAAVTHHPDDSYELAYPETARCVHPATGIVTTYYRGGMLHDLRQAGLHGNKHIPAAYLRASVAQRRALLAGLIDTDGHVSTSGQVSFDNANAALVHGVAELVRTLGYRAHVHRPTPPKLSTSGIQDKQAMWRVTFTPHDQGPARLTRKAATKLGRRERCAIVSITEDAPEPGRCITVDSEDGLYLVGEGLTPTHNSERASHWFPLWVLVDNPDLRIAIVSHDAELARGWGSAIKDNIEQFNGDEGTIDLGLRLRDDSRAKGRWHVEGRRGGLYCVSIGGSLTGRAVDLLIIDDPISNLEQAQSEAYRKRAHRFWQGVAVPRMGPHTKTILIQTRWHEDDLAGKLLATEGDRAKGGKWQVISIPAQCEDEATDPLGRKLGEYMVSTRGRTRQDWDERKKDLGSYVWAALCQQRPAPAEGGLFKRMWWRYFTHHDGWLTLGPRSYRVADCWRFATVDLAASTRASADWTVISAWARTISGDLVLLDRVRAHIGENAHFDAARPLVQRWQLDTLFVERSQYGMTLTREAANEGVPINPVDAESDKLTRALPASRWVERGRVWLPSAAGWLDEWIGEHAGFPNASHDDQVDTLSYAVRVAITSAAPVLTPPVPQPDTGEVDWETVAL